MNSRQAPVFIHFKRWPELLALNQSRASSLSARCELSHKHKFCMKTCTNIHEIHLNMQ